MFFEMQDYHNDILAEIRDADVAKPFGQLACNIQCDPRIMSSDPLVEILRETHLLEVEDDDMIVLGEEGLEYLEGLEASP